MVLQQPSRQSVRRRGFDYSRPRAYFVTVCAWQKECALGDVVDGRVQLSAVGEVVLAAWQSLAERFPTVRLDAFVIMPNHVHGILWLTNPVQGAEVAVRVGEGTGQPAPVASDRRAGGASSAPTRQIAPTLGRVIAVFKSISTVEANRRDGTQGRPLWQRNYYEHIVRDDADLQRIRRYIVDNPSQWEKDPEHPRNQGRDHRNE